MLKIVEIIPILSVRRGAESFFANLCVALKKIEDVHLEVVLLYDEIDDSFVKQFEDAGIKPFFCHKKKGFDFRASKIFKKIILDINPDIIHTHNCCFFTYYLSFGRKKMKWKYFHTCHSVPDIEATKLEHSFRKRFSRKGLITNIGISPLISESFKEKYKIEYVPYVLNGVPMSNDISGGRKEYDFIVCASIDENKNHKLLLDAFELLPNHDNYKLICLGNGPLFDCIKNVVEQRQLSNNVLLLGAVANVGEYLKKSRIFVLPSKNEGIPISIIEAMNYGLPIIASKVGGIPDLISEKNGILFQSDNKEDLAKAMELLLLDKTLYNEVSKFNREYSKKFSIDKVAKDYLNIFKGNYE